MTTDPFDLPPVVRDGDVVIEVPFHYTGSLSCYRCGNPTLSGAQVTDVWHADQPVCAPCAFMDDRLMPWQVLADAIQAIDAAMVAAGSRDARQGFADLIARDVGYMATWRSPDDEPIEPRP